LLECSAGGAIAAIPWTETLNAGTLGLRTALMT